MSNAASEAVQTAIRELVDANHILFDQGVVDGFGHVSVRHPERPDRFLLARSMAPALVTEKDILEFDLDGNPGGAKRTRALPGALHSRGDLPKAERREFGGA